MGRKIQTDELKSTTIPRQKKSHIKEVITQRTETAKKLIPLHKKGLIFNMFEQET